MQHIYRRRVEYAGKSEVHPKKQGCIQFFGLLRRFPLLITSSLSPFPLIPRFSAGFELILNTVQVLH